ncbi:Unannotated [Lentimonas sp. CC4]|nr:Unannotated [Lentimonas sp. CC4]CAA6686047.1 Unannotated [Lentimonas sp. CC6]CAA7077688.1 Unannotated [Lentimonas sp. CC4]CAA7168497.1 Unannotated [Lentimonas sp. CC21]CAA7182941.1 Unannotated [Lentimonas sp. CC8]
MPPAFFVQSLQVCVSRHSKAEFIKALSNLIADYWEPPDPCYPCNLRLIHVLHVCLSVSIDSMGVPSLQSMDAFQCIGPHPHSIRIRVDSICLVSNLYAAAISLFIRVYDSTAAVFCSIALLFRA